VEPPLIMGISVAALALASGSLIGITLSLIGGGGSVLAVPLLVYLVGLPSAHLAIGTASTGVALNAVLGLFAHARLGTVKWRCAAVFAAAGAAGAAIGSMIGKATSGTALLALFGVILILVGLSMLRTPAHPAIDDVRLTTKTAGHLLPRLVGVGSGVGLLSGFFGIGGGFLIVPGLMLATGMRLQNAIGTSLVGVTAFGVTTAASYTLSGLVDWRLAALLLAGGIAGSLLGVRMNTFLTERKRALSAVFASVVIAVGIFMIAHPSAGSESPPRHDAEGADGPPISRLSVTE
jgi:uncharacterized membrane protein YfcA